ncbi:C-factor [Clupea harengus]|uniref:C-factor n=1 Tax=Clupea harengus TaxID=7950 RepID=A0A6P3W298_CLUHA|nr:C-factor [Clupea harengus]
MAAKISGSVLVTGSNRGIGLELVRQLSESLCPPNQIFAGCRDPNGPKAKELRELAQKHQRLITLVCLDTTNQASITEAARVVGAKLKDGSLNLLINNAAVNIPGSLAETGEKQMMEVFQTNTVGPMLLTKEFLPYLRNAASQPGAQSEMSCRRSAVVNVSTLIASIEKCPETFHGAPMYPYRVSKAALNMLTRCLAEDLKKDGILVMALHPGWVKTDMGGPEAPLSTEESVKGTLNVISSLSEKHVGTLLDWEGKGIPW